MTKETFTFQAEVGKLLDIVAKSLYSQREVFLRELISNASDACDKRRYAAVTDEAAGPGEDGFSITIAADEKKKTIGVADNGIGMDRDDLIATLGTIARSGTQAFVEALEASKAEDAEDKKGKKKKGADASLIGQFGVGFYSAFMVADHVEVVTRKVHSDTAWRWESDGQGGYSIEETTRDSVGTDVIVHLTKEAKEYADVNTVRGIVKRYSDHIGHPIRLSGSGTDEAPDTINQGSALWSRPARDITEEQYTEFYHHVAHAFDAPWMTLHNAVEGVISYTNLLFIPSDRPYDLFHPDRKTNVKLYVNRVFVTDNCEGLLPSYLRFVRGIVDSPDLNLNISREMLQHDPKLVKISKGLVKRVLGQLKKKADKDPDEYQAFWGAFGAVVKEGLYEDADNRDALIDACRFSTTESGDSLASIDQIIERMKPGQEAIYYVSGENADQVAKSPHLEGFRAKGVEVLLLTDPVDEFWVGNLGQLKDKPLKSVTRGGADLDTITGDDKPEDEKKEDKPQAAGLDALIVSMKLALGDTVKDVRPSSRLRESAVCLVSDESDMDINLERLLREHNQLQADHVTPRILEINPTHPMIAGLAKRADKEGAGSDDVLTDAAHLLLDQARILQGEPVPDPTAFAMRFSTVLERSVAG